MRCVAACCSALQCVAACRSVLQCAAGQRAPLLLWRDPENEVCQTRRHSYSAGENQTLNETYPPFLPPTLPLSHSPSFPLSLTRSLLRFLTHPHATHVRADICAIPIWAVGTGSFLWLRRAYCTLRVCTLLLLLSQCVAVCMNTPKSAPYVWLRCAYCTLRVRVSRVCAYLQT